jgi:hypothetical protein
MPSRLLSPRDTATLLVLLDRGAAGSFGVAWSAFRSAFEPLRLMFPACCSLALLLEALPRPILPFLSFLFLDNFRHFYYEE